jgi:hypothetical protein
MYVTLFNNPTTYANCPVCLDCFEFCGKYFYQGFAIGISLLVMAGTIANVGHYYLGRKT